MLKGWESLGWVELLSFCTFHIATFVMCLSLTKVFENEILGFISFSMNPRS